MLNLEDTIVAQSSASGVSSCGIIRISGQDSLCAIEPLFIPLDFNFAGFNGGLISSNWKTLSYPIIQKGRIKPWKDPARERSVPCELYYWPKGRGFTGETCIELHLPGSPAIINATLRALCATSLVRLADRGEFSLRAFLNGKLDLTQAEAILGTIDANSDDELKNALSQLSGSASLKFDNLQSQLLDILTEIEAGLDFTEEDIEFISSEQIVSNLRDVLEQLQKALERAQTRLLNDQLPQVVLLGSPNAGKSSLFNTLVEIYGDKTQSHALVSNHSGTTRDYLRAELTFNNFRFVLIDSAGAEEIRTLHPDGKETPEKLAQQKLKEIVAESNLVILCSSAENAPIYDLPSIDLKGRKTIRVITKSDLLNEGNPDFFQRHIKTSTLEKEGLTELCREILSKLSSSVQHDEIVASTALRCQESLRLAKESIERALDIVLGNLFDEILLASEIRLALNQIGLITGQVHTNDLLDRIFSRFCIGK